MQVSMGGLQRTFTPQLTAGDPQWCFAALRMAVCLAAIIRKGECDSLIMMLYCVKLVILCLF